jgi:hypothetical protein
MSDQFFYVHLTFNPGRSARAQLREAVVEVPKDLVRSKQSESANRRLRERVIAVGLARRAALDTFAAGADLIAWPYDEDALWYEDRTPIMNERPCDYEKNGIRVWRIA